MGVGKDYLSQVTISIAAVEEQSYYGDGCQAGPCTAPGRPSPCPCKGTSDIINDQTVACAFNNLDDSTRGQRLDGLRRSGYKPDNADEAAVFLAHVYHETAGLTTVTEYCVPGKSHSVVSSRSITFHSLIH